jgi:hypothetical protein
MAIKTNGETVETDILNLFGLIFRDNIFKWGENFVQDQPNCTFQRLKQAFCKRFKTIKSDEEVYMQLQNNQ